MATELKKSTIGSFTSHDLKDTNYQAFIRIKYFRIENTVSGILYPAIFILISLYQEKLINVMPLKKSFRDKPLLI
ncbi:MAG: hypothetical protein MUW56_20330 [Chryseobacterium sp.]|uniref:hypothetical protein n=1 Tax=Chryseobacterium sp. TaxID=1871047 RepID=UPI0025C5F157|nr:hypothetical protein [Chryseobacterium sp.]MCJ7935906.1 hypothetical protein [Chryseobacterium sp.]